MVEDSPQKSPETEDKEAPSYCYYGDPSHFVSTIMKYLFASVHVGGFLQCD